MAYEFVPLSADTEDEDKPYSFVSLESIQAKENEPARRRDVTPFKVDIQQPAPVAARPAPVASAPSEDYTDAMGSDFGSAIMAAATPAPPAPVRSVLNTPQAQRAFQEEQLAKPGAMLRPEYVDSVRSSFAGMAPDKRLTALTEMSKGSGAQAQAAQRILVDVQAEDKRNQELSLGRESMIGLIANAARVPPGPRESGTAPPEPVAVSFPDVAAKPFDTLEGLSEQERVDKALRLDEARRGVVQSSNSIRAIADSIDLASRDLSAEAFAKENPFLGALASGGGQIVSGIGNAIPTVVDFAARLIDATKTDVDSTGNLALSFDTGTFNNRNVRAPTYDWADRLATSAKSFMPEAGKQNLASAVAKGEFGSWFGLNLVAQAPQIAANFVASVIPAARPFVLPAMGAATAGQAYGEGDSSFGALLKGGAEIAGEKATFGIFDRTYAALAKLPLSLQAPTVQSVGRALAATGAAVTAQSIGGAIEEVTTQVIQNGVDKFVEGKDVGLLDQVADAAVLGAAMQGALSIPHGRKAFQGGKNAFAEAFAGDVAGTQFNPAAIDSYARRALDVQSYDANIITPRQQAMVQQDQAALQSSVSASDAAAAADNLAGSLDEMLVPGNAVTPLPTRIEPTLDLGLPLEAQGLPARMAPIEAPLDLGLPPADQGLPAINPAIEQQFGLDKLRINAPRPQSVQGQPVANLTDDNLTSIANDETAHSMTRRSAAIELTARQAEQQAPVAQTFTPAALGAMTLGERRTMSQNFDQTENEDGTTTFTAKSGATPTPSAAPAATPETNFGLGAAEGRVSDAPVTATGDTARADLQARLNAAAAQHGVEVPTLAAPAKSDEATITAIGKALGATGPVVAYSDANGADGFQLGGAIAINTKTQKGVAATAFHENHHIAEQIAAADTQAGRTDTPAQQYVASVNGLFDDMSDEGKRSYTVNFLHKAELASIADPVAREQRTQQLLSGQTLRSEMVADFMGNRATDRPFLADLAKADPKGFGGFVQKWIGILDNMLVRLRGVKDKSNLESVKVDQYIKDLNRAKMVARDAMVAFRNGTLQESATATTPLAFSQQQGEVNAPSIGPTGSQILPGASASDRRGLDEYGSNPPPSYGTARQGAISVVGRHYSATPRQTLSGEYYGRGLKGAERTRLDSSPDPRLRNRVYYYVDQGKGIRPESGVGGYAHETKLDNIYDPQTRLIKPQADANAFESAVINAGFDGYIAPFGNGQSAVVLLGMKHKAVPVRAIGQPQAAALPAEAAPTTLKKGLMSKELSQIDTSNIPGARVRAGTLEIPAGQVEAANAELARIGSAVQFSAKEKPKTVNEGRIRRSIDELVAAADSQKSWQTWYTRHEKTIVDTFGEDANLFQKLLSATSQATGVKGNVTLALKAYDQLLSGQPFTGYLPAVIKNLDRIANDEKLEGAKISQYGQANEGDVDAIAVDRHIAMLFFNTKTPNPRQIKSAKERIKIVAARLKWEPRQVQAALWAFNQVRLGTDPAKVESYDKILEARADTIAALRAYHGRGTGGGVQVGGAVSTSDQDRASAERQQGPVPVAKTSTELELGGVKFSAKQRNLTDIPTITFRDLVGKKVVGIKADLTTAGISYTGIDGSQLEFPVEMLGGPNFVRLPENTKSNVVWAVRGGATLSKIMAKVNESDYVLVHAMNDNSHLTNATVSQAYVQTVEAYLRDKRISPENLLALDKIVQSSENKNSLLEFPGFESPNILSYIDGLSFDQRGALAKMLETKQAQALGLPNLDRFRRETMDAEYAGYRQGDTMLVIEIDKKNPTVKLGEEGTKMHPSYPLGLRGRVVGKLAKGVNYELIFRDYFENKVPTLGNKEAGAWYAFDRVLPVQEITSEIADALGEGGYENIASSRQAQASLALANNQWLESGKTRATGGISTTEFVGALRANEGAAALTLYDADEVKAGVKDGSFKIYQLGKEGGNKGIQIFFGLKRGKPWYADMIDGIKANEVEVVSVINNEPGAPGVATPAIITKAIAEGATVLDAFAVKSARFPDGFLPEMYGQFGFETIGTIPFDASYYDANKLSDLKAFWAKGGWKEADGYPDVVVMRWKGKDADRQSAIERYVRTGETRVSTRPDYVGAATGNPAEQRNPPRGGEGRTRGGDSGPAGRIQGADNAAPVVRRAYGSLQELADLSAGDIRNLGLNPEDVARLRDQLAPGATPGTEAIFAGLEKRGLAKSKAETALANHPDSAQLKYVQDNFTDILIELEDADKVKINCD